jgi:hypothetical protein
MGGIGKGKKTKNLNGMMCSLYRSECSNLKLAKPLWEGDEELMKRSSRDEPMWVVTHMCMETTQGISPCSYLHLKLAKMLFFLSYMFFLQQNQRTRGQNRFYPEVGWGEEGGGPNNVHTCK